MPSKRPTNDIRQLLLRTLSRIDDLDLPGPLGRSVSYWQREVIERDSELDVVEWVERLRGEIAEADALLRQLQEQLAEVQRESVPLDTRWWSDQRSAIRTARQTGRHETARSLWLSAWAQALGAGQLDLALAIARSRTARPDPDSAEATRSIANGLREPTPYTLVAHVYRLVYDVAPGVQSLLETGSPLTLETLMVLGTLQTRIWLRAERIEAAQEAVDSLDRRLAAADLAESPPLQGHVDRESVRLSASERAALLRAEVEVAAGRLDPARTILDDALTLPAPPSDALVVAAQLAEEDGLWTRADALCDAALAEDGSIITALLAPVPARLRVRAAHRLADHDPAVALHQLDLALDQGGIRGASDYPETDVHLERARLLQRLGQPGAASEAMVEAANRWAWSGNLLPALDLYAEAVELPGARASAWWWYAEALRLEAIRRDDIIDRDRMTQAADALQHGLARAEPGRDDAWVLVTHALILDALDPLDPLPLELTERALLLDEDYVLAYGFLAQLLQGRGQLSAALNAARQGRKGDADLTLVRDQLCSLLVDVGAYDEALRLIDGELRRAPDDQTMLVRRASVEMATGRTDAALATAASMALGDERHLLLGTYESARGDWRAARKAFLALAASARVDTDRLALAGWAAYRTGRLDDAISLYEPIAAKAAARLSYGCDLGQMLLVRGEAERDDLNRGERLLRAGIAAATSPDNLRELRSIEFAMIRHDLAGRPHEERVLGVLAECAGQIDRRVDDLVTARPPASPPWSRWARARESLASGDAADAVRIYAELITDDPHPALGSALLRAAVALFDQADALVRDGRVSDARRAWDILSLAVPRIEEGEVLGAALAARRAVARLAADPDATDDVVAVLRIPELGSRVLADAVDLVATDPGPLWRLYDALTGLAGQHGDFSVEERSAFGWLASEIPLATAYRLDQDVEPQTATKRLVSAVEVRLSRDLADLDAELKRRMRDLRDSLATEMGVAIPGVRRQIDDAFPPDQVDFLIYQQIIASTIMDPDDPDPATEIIATLDRVLRAQLYRLLGPDDVRLWLARWQPTSVIPAGWHPVDDPARARLRLVRVLRMLLRENIPVGDIDLIASAFAEADGTRAGPIDTLRAVRRALGPAVLGAPPNRVRLPLPIELEERIGAGLARPSDQPTRSDTPTPSDHWELPRDQSAALVNDLRDWLAATLLPAWGEPAVIVVANPAVRLFAWRLLAGAAPAICVLAEEELR